jgi:hypothetical protein
MGFVDTFVEKQALPPRRGRIDKQQAGRQAGRQAGSREW